MFKDDLERMDRVFLFYDAFYRWCHDATDESHLWFDHKKGPAK